MLIRQGVALGATALAGTITANAVQAAPAALAGTIATAALAASTLTSATVAITTLQKLAVTALLAATIGGGIYAAKQASDAHKAVRELHALQAPMAEQMRQLQSSLTDATNWLTQLSAENLELKSGKDKMEVLKLRGEVAAMRTQLASLQNKRPETTNGAGETLHVRNFRINARAFPGKSRLRARASRQQHANPNHRRLFCLQRHQFGAAKVGLSSYIQRRLDSACHRS